MNNHLYIYIDETTVKFRYGKLQGSNPHNGSRNSFIAEVRKIIEAINPQTYEVHYAQKKAYDK